MSVPTPKSLQSKNVYNSHFVSVSRKHQTPNKGPASILHLHLLISSSNEVHNLCFRLLTSFQCPWSPCCCLLSWTSFCKMPPSILLVLSLNIYYVRNQHCNSTNCQPQLPANLKDTSRLLVHLSIVVMKGKKMYSTIISICIQERNN